LHSADPPLPLQPPQPLHLSSVTKISLAPASQVIESFLPVLNYVITTCPASPIL
jgi:hypothetical protein